MFNGCPECGGGPLALLGQLGPLLHCRCVDCGAQVAFNVAAEMDDARDNPLHPWHDDQDEPHPFGDRHA